MALFWVLNVGWWDRCSATRESDARVWENVLGCVFVIGCSQMKAQLEHLLQILLHGHAFIDQDLTASFDGTEKKAVVTAERISHALLQDYRSTTRPTLAGYDFRFSTVVLPEQSVGKHKPSLCYPSSLLLCDVCPYKPCSCPCCSALFIRHITYTSFAQPLLFKASQQRSEGLSRCWSPSDNLLVTYLPEPIERLLDSTWGGSTCLDGWRKSSTAIRRPRHRNVLDSRSDICPTRRQKAAHLMCHWCQAFPQGWSGLFPLPHDSIIVRLSAG